MDMSQWLTGLDNLGGPIRESLARRMAVSGGIVLRDEAKALAPKGVAEAQAIRQYGGSLNPGALENAMYLALNETMTTDTIFTYTISWNSKKAPHGHLLEFGHWQPYVVVFTEENGWITLNVEKDTPTRVPAYPFLGPAYESKIHQALQAMLDRGRAELPKLIAGDA